MRTQTFIETLTVMTCSVCHMPYGMTTRFESDMRSSRATFYCPIGHRQYFPGKTPEQERDAAREQTRRAYTALTAARDQANAAERSARAYKGHVTRIRNLVAKGICPVAGCRRNFTNVREHMATQHPDFHTHEDGAS